MPGPGSEAEARRWVRQAIVEGRYVPSVHFKTRCVQRKVGMLDVHRAIGRSRSISPYPSMPKNGGTCWTFWGSNVDGTMTIGVGLEAFTSNDESEWVILCTVLPPEEK